MYSFYRLDSFQEKGGGCYLHCRHVKRKGLIEKGLRKVVEYHFPERQILDTSKLKLFAHNNFKFDENGRKFSKQVENTLLRSNFSFPTEFSKALYCRHKKPRACIEKGYELLLNTRPIFYKMIV